MKGSKKCLYLLSTLLLLFLSSPEGYPEGNTFLVSTGEELAKALSGARPGDSILLEPGVYSIPLQQENIPDGLGSTIERKWFFRGDAQGSQIQKIRLASKDAQHPAILNGMMGMEKGFTSVPTSPYSKEGDGKKIGDKGLLYSRDVHHVIVRKNKLYQEENPKILRGIHIIPRTSAGVPAEFTAHTVFVHDNTFYLKPHVPVGQANKGSEQIYMWNNQRVPSEGKLYNSRIIPEKPTQYLYV